MLHLHFNLIIFSFINAGHKNKYWRLFMKSKIIFEIQNNMKSILSQDQFLKLTKVLINTFENIEIVSKNVNYGILDNFKLLNLFISAKKVEGCSIKTLKYYRTTLEDVNSFG